MSTQPLSVGLIISSLGSGGAERTVVRLAGQLQARGMRVTVLTYSRPETDFYQLPDSVARVPLDLMRRSSGPVSALQNNLRRLRVLRKAIQNGGFDVVVSFMDSTNVQTLLAASGLPVRVVISERIHPQYHKVGAVWRALRARLYGRADTVVAQTGQIAAWLKDNTAARRVAVVPNFSDAEAAADVPLLAARPKRIIAAGRLHRQKGFDLLLAALAAQQAPLREGGWQVCIFGEGPERDVLQQQLDSSGLGEWVKLAGKTTQLATEMQQSRVFVLSSRYEGFPNVLLEAMTAGCAVCAFDGVSGVAELISDGEDGLTAKGMDPAGLGAVLLRLCEDTALTERLGPAALAKSAQFSPAAVVPLWEAVLRGGAAQ
ncbi:glycosyltransferase [Granulosicoccaceae sp. 1_MG-2023]|nr:glycosyltransferase [Granulosicoccaceae sp. 1_MG-2023]